jgi:hypothetical protein
MRAVTALLVLAACEEGIVLEVHVHPEVPSTRVELFLALDKCADCSGLQLEKEGAPRPGPVYYRDGDPDAIAPVDSDGIARFRLEPSAQGDRFKIALAVGRDDRPVNSAMTTAAAVIAPLELGDGPRVIVTDLEKAATTLPDPTNAADGRYLSIWRQDSGNQTACVAFERWKGGVVDRAFIVPQSDPDCDGPADCKGNEYAAGSKIVPSLEKPESLTCTGTFMIGSAPRMPCMLGGELCIDGEAPGRPCGPSFTCVADALCMCDTADRGCLSTALVSNLPQPRFSCHFPIESAGGSDYRACPGTSRALADLGALGLTCTSALQMSPIEKPVGPFASDMTLTIGGRTVMVASPPVSFLAPCSFDVVWQGSVGLVGPVATQTTAVAMLELGGDPERRALVAFDLVFEVPLQGCGAMGVEASCGPGGTVNPDGIAACF